MNAIELLKKQHLEVERIFGLIEKSEDSEEKEALADDLTENLAAHATIEERLFYPTAFRDETEDLLREAVEEHLSMKRLLEDLLTMSAEDENFDAKIKVLKEQVLHHVEEEEKKLFKKVKQSVSKEELEALGMQMEAMFEELMSEDPAENIPNETDRAAPLP
jgi:hypothetical protein